MRATVGVSWIEIKISLNPLHEQCVVGKASLLRRGYQGEAHIRDFLTSFEVSISCMTVYQEMG